MSAENAKIIEEEISTVMWELSKKIKRSRLRFLNSFGLTSSQMEVMGFLFHNSKENPNEEMTQITISRQTYIDPMTTSTIVKNLEKKELIYRIQSKADSRALCVCLTKEGEILCEKIIHIFEDFKKGLLLNIDKEVFYQQLLILLENIKNNNCLKSE